MLEGLFVWPPNAEGFCRVSVDETDERSGLYSLGMLQLLPGVEITGPREAIVPANIAWSAPTNDHFSKKPLIANYAAPSGLKLRQYQREALSLIENAALGALVALDVGLGKCMISLSFLARHPELRPFLVVAPLIGMGAWVGPNSDTEKHFGMCCSPLRSLTPEQEKIEKRADGQLLDGYFINYDILQLKWIAWILLQINPKVVIVDESHETRNGRSRQGKAVNTLCYARTIKKRIFLTATPVVNTVMDLYNQLDSAQPGLWGEYCLSNQRTSFGSRYASESRSQYGVIFGGESNVAELRRRLANVMIRRSRDDVRTELPPMTRQCIEVPTERLDAEAFGKYRTAVNSIGLAELLRQSSTEQLKRGTEMLGQLSWSKRTVAAEAAIALLPTRRKLVVFSWYRKMAAFVAKQLRQVDGCAVFGPVDGVMKIEKRLDEAQRFHDLELVDGQSAAFVATMKAAGISLNPLSCASAALFVDLYWVPATLLQAEGRIHREGQRSDDVLIQYLVVRGSSDDIIWRKLERKSKSIATTTGDKAGVSLVEELGGKDEGASMKGLLQELGGLEQLDFELT